MSLYTYDNALPLILRTDASSYGLGGMLVMVKDGKELPINFFAKKFSKQEQNWTTIEQEAFAVIYGLRKNRQFCLGRHFRIETDHRNLTFVLKSESAKLMRWRLELAEYTFEIAHVSGVDNKMADYLSRKHQPVKETVTAKSFISPKIEPSIREKVISEQKKLTENPEKLIRIGEFLDDQEGRIVIPDDSEDLQKEIIHLFHAHVLAGHYSATYTAARIIEAGRQMSDLSEKQTSASTPDHGNDNEKRNI
ncbi:hypothetical protein ADUPG1_005568 [Aduncisulcus paluster]|uniref:Reverse transcriptase RNase H-like domain-containing protein n=1 Tax=Aduncisulcus paluster TaxID=2918883 RepID=A0ABQ5KDJ3_9EUKA|nr:hypothetical protein ADUPG1_005568 [Aduncisulcus paluster]